MQVIQPLDAPDQQFSVLIDAKRVTFRLRYNGHNDRWSMDLSVDGEEKLRSKRLVQGVNLIEGHTNLGIEGGLFVYGNIPNRTNLVNGNTLIYYVTQDEIDNGEIST